MTKARKPVSYVPSPDYTRKDWDEVADNPELTEEEFAKAKTASEVFTPEQLASLMKRRPGQRGRGKKSAKVSVTLRLDPDVIEAFKAGGAGWQTRINDTLRHAAKNLT